MKQIVSMAGPNINSIEDFAYGKGYVFVAEEFGKLLNLLSEVVNRGIHVVITAHAKMRKFEQPDELGAYDRWEMKLSKQAAPLLKEWCDLLLFCNYKTLVVKTGADKKGNGGKNKAQGGKRIMYASHHACWDAKNRMGLPDELPLDYAPLAPYFDTTLTGTYPPIDPYEAIPSAPVQPPVPTPSPAPVQPPTLEQAPEEPYKNPIPVDSAADPAVPVDSGGTNTAAPAAVPAQPVQTAAPGVGTGPAQTNGGAEQSAQAAEVLARYAAEDNLQVCLSDPAVYVTANGYINRDGELLKESLQEFYPLMETAGVKAEEVKAAIASKGYFPPDTALENLPDDFIRGCLIGAWGQVKRLIFDMRGDSDLPFTFGKEG